MASCLSTTEHGHSLSLPSLAAVAVAVPEPLDVLVGHLQGSISDFCLSLLPEGSLLRHLLGMSELHRLHLHGLGLGDLPLALPRQGAGAGLMP